MHQSNESTVLKKDSRELNRVHVAHIIIGLDVGGAERALQRLVLSAGECRSTVISLTKLGTLGSQMLEKHLNVIAIGMRGPMSIPIVFWRLQKLLRRLRPDVVQTWMYHSDLLGGLAARAARVPVVVWGVRNTDILAGDGVAQSTRHVANLCARLSYRVPDRIVCVAESTRHTHVQMGYAPDKLDVIPNGYDLPAFPSAEQRVGARAQLGLPQGIPLIGSVARFNKYKDHATFIAAASQLAHSLPGVSFVLAGRDIVPENKMLMNSIERNGYRHRFHLLGEQQQIQQVFQAIDLFCLHSVSEGCPNVVGEAMAMGLPCVVTDVGDAGRMVGESGKVVPRQNAAALAQALYSMLVLSPDERWHLGQLARARILKHYSLESVLCRYERLWSTLVNKSRQ